MAESIDRSGYARATFAPREGMIAAVPPLRERPTLSMRDMAMSHGDHQMAATSDEPNAMEHDTYQGHQMPVEAPARDGGHDGHQATMPDSMALQSHDHAMGVGVDSIAETPANRLNEPGIGLENTGHRVLTYSQLRALTMNPDMRAPEREMELHLTGNMERYMWSFDGLKFSEVDAPIEFQEGERLRLTLVNDTMMSHPIHLHGMFFDVVTDTASHFKPRKHTIVVKPGEKLSVDVTADAVGDWAFHCHLLYHMMAGMMQVVSVKPRRHHQHHDMKQEPVPPPMNEHHGHHGGAK
jgi:CopA family copper-resistance protein